MNGGLEFSRKITARNEAQERGHIARDKSMGSGLRKTDTLK